MAELATIARPYAEALFKVAGPADSASTGEQLAAIAAVTADPQVRLFADSPRTTSEQVYELIASVVKVPLSYSVTNLLKTMIENGRLPAMTEVAAQFHALASAQSGIADATVYSPYPIEDAALADVVATLEKRFGRKLAARVEIAPELIGGIRVVVGDEVLDTSVKARLEQMKVALTA